MGIAKEADLMMKSIDAYFNRFGASGRNQLKSSMGIVAMLSNLNMLGRVTISSLGDLVQPVQHSSKWTSAIRGLLRTNLFRAQWEKGPARNMNYHFTNEMNKAVFKSAGLEGNNVAFRQGFMGNWRDYGVKDIAKTSTWNNIAFKALGLEWLTGYARRFAYNTAAIDAHLLARSYVKAVQKNGANSRGALLLLDDLTKYNIKANQALTIGKFKNFDSALQNKISKESLNTAGMIGSNRDALIPQFENRLLFTQSQTPWIRILGQFLSWAQAKSAQTNKILMRVESGDARQLIKTLAVIPVYGAIQQLREIAKYGEVYTHPDYDMGKFLAKSGQLSGMSGWIIDLFFNRFLGPGKRDPWFNFAPAMQILSAPVVAAQQVIAGKSDAAIQTLSKRFLPFPNWRRWVRKLWFPQSLKGNINKGTKVTFSKGGRVRFEKGNVAETAAMEDININQQMDKAIENNILPSPPIEEELLIEEELPIVEEQILPQKKANQIDWDWIGEREGVGKEIGYVPVNKTTGKIIGKSGVTIATGVDLGDKDRNFFNDMDVSEEIITKLEPFFNLKGADALLQAENLKLSSHEVKELDTAIKKKYGNDVINAYEKDSGKNFEDLTSAQQTVITSVAFQHGDLETSAPNFWNQVLNDKWDAAIANLRDWDGTGKPSQTQDRRDLEADLLEGLFEKEKK